MLPQTPRWRAIPIALLLQRLNAFHAVDDEAVARLIATKRYGPSLDGIGGGLESHVERVGDASLRAQIARADTNDARTRRREMDADDVEALAPLAVDLDVV